jgi:Raf kinase inhibitor-like YbhB/YbcL family protein
MLAALVAAFTLTSPAFHAGATIPKRYTCDGADVSPALRWTAPPRGTKSLSLSVVDPDAPGGHFVHWRIPRLAASKRGLPAGSRLGARNSAGTNGWTGPCPPAGPAHHYRFELRALAANGKVLAAAVLVARYGRA